jgi:hypothetical protein
MPGRVASITLLDPAGLTKLDARFWWWLTISGLASLTPMPLRRHLARWLDSPAMLERELMTLMWAGSRGYRMEPKFPGVLTDGELRTIDVPALLITGARSAMLTPAEARARASLMPHAEVAIVPGSHGGFNRIDELNDRIAAFIQAHTTGKDALRPGSRAHDAEVVAQDDRLDPVAQPELGEDPGHVGLDRRLGHDELGGDLAVVLAHGHEGEDLDLTRAQRL